MKIIHAFKIYVIWIFYFVILFFIRGFEAYAQDGDQNMLEVFGQLTSDLGTLNNAEIKIKEDDFEWLNVKFSKRSGEFNLALPVGHTFLFSFTQEGTIAKQISFSTKTPKEYEKVEFDPFFFMVHLEDYTDTPELDTLFYKEPVGKIFFSEEFIKFDYDRDYNLYVKNKIAQVKEEVQLKQQLIAQREEQRRLDSIANANMLAQMTTLKDTLILDENSATGLPLDTITVAVVDLKPDSVLNIHEREGIVAVTEDSVLTAYVDEPQEIPVEATLEQPVTEIEPEEKEQNVEPLKEIVEEQPIAETKKEELNEPMNPVQPRAEKKPEPVPVAMGKSNGNEYEFHEYKNMQVTKIYVTRSKKTIIYSMYQYNNGNTRYYKQQPFTNDSIPINRDVFTRSIR
ncbi:hypothetical protein ACE1ET_09950 [Saccharicrinis sp. FJH62]|uniref:hypothetical protein n=1 Tax=Saccharicrinis sp. FJH62 TaxID=3344657 RepID=UPI0035D40A79